jgi:hypothetical protein
MRSPLVPPFSSVVRQRIIANVNNNELIQEIQQKVDAIRVDVSSLDAQLSDAGLKQHLKQASFWLDDVEKVFLRSARQEKRTPDELSRWLSYAAVAVEWAAQREKEIHEIIWKCGPDAKSVGA